MNLLIIRPAALGDTLMLMPSLHALRQEAQTTLVGRRPGIDFLVPHVHRVMDFEARGWHSLFMDDEETAFSLSLPSADLAVLFHTDPDGKIAARLQTLLPGTPVKGFPGFPTADDKTHVARYLADCLEASGCPIDPERCFEEALRSPLLRQAHVGERFHPLPPEAKNVGEGFHPLPPEASNVGEGFTCPAVARSSSKGRRRIPSRRNAGGRAVFHPGSGGRAKNHPPEFWLNLINHFGNSLSFPATLLLGPAEEALLSFFHDHLQQPKTEILFCPDKETLFSLLARSRLYAGHDSGITHLAAMLGTSTLAFFRTTSVIQWRPLGPKVRIIEGEGSGPDMLEQALALASDLLKMPD